MKCVPVRGRCLASRCRWTRLCEPFVLQVQGARKESRLDKADRSHKSKTGTALLVLAYQAKLQDARDQRSQTILLATRSGVCVLTSEDRQSDNSRFAPLLSDMSNLLGGSGALTAQPRSRLDKVQHCAVTMLAWRGAHRSEALQGLLGLDGFCRSLNDPSGEQSRTLPGSPKSLHSWT